MAFAVAGWNASMDDRLRGAAAALADAYDVSAEAASEVTSSSKGVNM